MLVGSRTLLSVAALALVVAKYALGQRLQRRPSDFPERDTRLELATPSLGSSCSTN
jgi:hypothetical protein